MQHTRDRSVMQWMQTSHPTPPSKRVHTYTHTNTRITQRTHAHCRSPCWRWPPRTVCGTRPAPHWCWGRGCPTLPAAHPRSHPGSPCAHAHTHRHTWAHNAHEYTHTHTHTDGEQHNRSNAARGRDTRHATSAAFETHAHITLKHTQRILPHPTPPHTPHGHRSRSSTTATEPHTHAPLLGGVHTQGEEVVGVVAGGG